jgi:hypothetical protein
LARFPKIHRIKQSFKTNVHGLRVQKIYVLIAIILSISLAVVAGKGFLQSDGYVYLAEQFEVYNLDQLQHVVYPPWNEETQRFILADLTKYYVVMPIIGVAKVINALMGIDGYKTLQAILLLSPISISFLSAFKLTHYIASKFSSNSFQQFLSAILGAFVFTINPWFATNPRDYMFRLEYSILPLLVYLFLKMIYSRDRRYIVFLALALSIIPSYRSLLLTSIMFLAILVLDVLLSGRARLLAKAPSVGIVIGLVFLLTGAKFLPSFLYSGSVEPGVVAEFHVGLVDRENILNILTTKFQEGESAFFELTYDDNFHLLFLAITICGFLYPFLLYKNRKVSKEHAVLFALPIILYIVSILLSAKELNLDHLITNGTNPFSEELGRLLRHARWNIMPALVGIAIMISLSSLKIFSIFKRSYIFALLASFLLVTSSISAWPFFSGDMNGYWRPARPPEDYIALNNLLKDREGEDLHHILWLPQYLGEHRTVWSNSRGIGESAAPTGIFPIRSSSLPSYAAWQDNFFDYYNPIRGIPSLNPMPVFSGNLTKAYSPLNIHYLAITYDTAWSNYRQSLGFTNEYLKHAADNFATNGSANTIFNGTYLTGFELHNDPGEFYSARPILLLDRLSTYGELLPFINKDSGVIFGTSQEAIEFGATVSDDLVLSDSTDLLVLAKNQVLVEPAKFTNSVDPENAWSPGSPEIRSQNLPLYDEIYSKSLSWSWPFDYGYGLVYTSASNAILKLQVDVAKPDNYQVFLRYLKNNAGGSFEVDIDGRTTSINSSKDYGSKFEWLNLGSYGFSSGKKEIELKNLSGLNMVNVMMMIPSSNIQRIYQDIETTVSKKELIYFYEAEHDFYDYERKGQRVSIRNSDTGLQFLEDGTIGLKLNILKEADYRLNLKGKGNFSFSITDKNSNTRQNDRLQLETLNYSHSNNPMHLAPGEYELIISSTRESYLDQAMLHTSKRPIDQLLNSAPQMQMISYNKITPTSYEVKVKSHAPFLLAFAEGYDRFWTAKARSSDHSREFNSLPLYDVINGFWIDKTGEFILTIEYEPQEWFNISAIISTTTLVCTLIYLTSRHFKLRQLFPVFRYQWKRIKGASK